MNKYVLIFLLVFIACKRNLYEKNIHQKNSLSRVSKYLEEQKPESALTILVSDLDEDLKQKLLNRDFSDETLEPLIHAVNFDPHILNLFSSTYANIAGVDIVNLALKIEKFKTENHNSDLLVQELLPLFRGSREDIAMISFAREIKEVVRQRGESDEIYIATLTTAEILFSLKIFDLDGDFDVSPEESKLIHIDDIERLYNLIQKLIADSSSIQVLAENPQVKKVLARFEKINEKIDTVLKDGNKEKIKVVVKGILREIQDKEADIVIPLPKSDPIEIAPAKLEIQVDQDDRRQVQSMVVFGDSMAVGVGVAYKKGQVLTTEELAYHPGIEEALKQSRDSEAEPEQSRSDQNIIQTFDGAYSATLETIKHCKENNDERCYSHASRLKVTFLKNYAMSGSKIQEVLKVQIPLFLESKSHVDFVVINVGGNDFCSNNFQQEVFVESYKQVLTALYNYSSKPIILLVPPPNVVKVFTALKDDSPAFAILDEETQAKPAFTCGDIRWVFCPRAALNRPNLSSQAHVIESIIEGISKAVSEVQDQSEAKRIFIAEQMVNLEITPDIIGIDCFHPNKEGYIKIAETTFKAIEEVLKPYEEKSE